MFPVSMFSAARWMGAASLALALAGCSGDGTKDDPEPDDIYRPVCPDVAVYEITATFSMDGLQECFGDPQSQSFYDDLAAALAPDWVVAPANEDCDLSVDPSSCTLTFSSVNPWTTFTPQAVCNDGTNSCDWVDNVQDTADTLGVADDCCSYQDGLESAFESARDELQHVLEDACLGNIYSSISLTSTQPDLPPDHVSPYNVGYWQLCSEDDAGNLLDSLADFRLNIAPSASFVSAQNGLHSLQVPLNGAMLAQNHPANIYRATVWAGDGQMGENSFVDWRFALDEPLAMQVQNGVIHVPHQGAPSFHARGTFNGDDVLTELTMGSDATGTFDLTTNAWTLDFTQVGGPGSSLHVHLEGSIDQL